MSFSLPKRSHLYVPVVFLAFSIDQVIDAFLTSHQVLSERTHKLRAEIDRRRAWLPSLMRDIKKQVKTQPFLFYGGLLAVFFGILQTIQTITSIWSIVLALRAQWKSALLRAFAADLISLGKPMWASMGAGRGKIDICRICAKFLTRCSHIKYFSFSSVCIYRKNKVQKFVYKLSAASVHFLFVERYSNSP